MSSFPLAKDALNNPSADDDTKFPSGSVQPHHTQHSVVNDAVEALEDKVGLDASTPSNHKALMGTASAGHSQWRQPTTADLSDVDLTGIAVGDLLQWDGTKFVKATVPQLTDLVWEGDSVPTGGFIGP